MDVRLATRQFQDHAAALTTGCWNGTTYISGIYDRLRESLTGQTTSYGAGGKSRPPCRVDALSLLTGIDLTVAAWWPDANTTPDRLAKMCEHRWTPDQVNQLNDHTHQLQQWTVAGRDLLGDNPIAVPLRKPCPRCGALWYHRHTGQDTVRSYALTASETGAECLRCHATWPPEQYGLLTRLLEDTHA